LQSTHAISIISRLKEEKNHSFSKTSGKLDEVDGLVTNSNRQGTPATASFTDLPAGNSTKKNKRSRAETSPNQQSTVAKKQQTETTSTNNIHKSAALNSLKSTIAQVNSNPAFKNTGDMVNINQQELAKLIATLSDNLYNSKTPINGGGGGGGGDETSEEEDDEHSDEEEETDDDDDNNNVEMEVHDSTNDRHSETANALQTSENNTLFTQKSKQTHQEDLVIRLEGKNLHLFRDPVKLQKEIERCGMNVGIDNAFINNRNNQLVIFATTMQDADKLNQVWPQDAFNYGIKKAEKKDRLYSFVIKGVHPSINHESENWKAAFSQYGIINAKRIVKKSETRNLSLIKAQIQDKKMLEKIKLEGMKVGYTNYRIEDCKIPIRLLQCYRCQKLDHTSETCQEEKTICVACAGDHHHKDCPRTITRCAN
jgi:hypothetical protein